MVTHSSIYYLYISPTNQVDSTFYPPLGGKMSERFHEQRSATIAVPVSG